MPVIIGIAGPSCSGKTTVARLVAEQLRAPLLHLDRHWVKGAEKPIVAGYPSFEQPHQYDGEALLAEARWTEAPVVVVEGFLLFTYRSALQFCQHKFLIDAPHDVLVARRLARSSSTEYDGVWTDHSNDADAGWHAHGEAEWARFGRPMHDLPGVLVMDGRKSPGCNAMHITMTAAPLPAMTASRALEQTVDS